MPEPLFEFFEVIATELAGTSSKVITHEDFRIGEEVSPFFEAMMRYLKVVNVEATILAAVKKLTEHFEAKGAELPFQYQPETGKFTATCAEFLSFVSEMKDMRSIGKRSRDFECNVARRLGERATGSIHRVGHPRDRKKSRVQLNRHLKKLGFSRPVVYGKEKDGGLDILWFLPVGAIPHKPIVSVQCKNGEFDTDEADKSIGAGSRSLGQNERLQVGIHVPCVLFNDYIHQDMLAKKQFNFVPLGLTDLAPLKERISVHLI